MPIKFTGDLSQETLQTRREWSDIFQILVQILDGPHLMQPSADVPEKAVENGQELGPCPHVEGPEEAPESWCCTRPASYIADMWGMNQYMEDTFLYPFFYFSSTK